MLVKLGKELALSDDYSYGLLLPLVSVYIVYLKWLKIRSWNWRPSWLGVLFMAMGFGIFILGQLAAELYTTRFSFVVTLFGLIFLLGGWKLSRLLIFPLLLLVLMIPLPELITYKLTLPLQLLSSRLASGILQFLGVPVFREGNIIDLGTQQLQVVSACSGLRYILSLLALGIVFCYFYQRTVWKAGILLVSLIPAAIIANALRVAAIALIPAFGHGFWHGFSGWIIFLFCFAFLSLASYGLNLIWPSPRPAETDPPSVTPGAGQPGKQKLLVIYLLAGLALMLIAEPVANRASRVPPVPPLQSFDLFPMELGSWRGHTTFIDPAMVDATQTSAHLYADFTNPGHGPVSLWIAYYDTQKKAGGFVHSPKGCLTASGWETKESEVIEIPGGLRVNYMLVDHMGTSLVVYYWFLQRGRWLTSEYLNKFYMAYDGVVRHRTDGALIRLITPAGRDVDAARNRLNQFTILLAPELHHFIPD